MTELDPKDSVRKEQLGEAADKKTSDEVSEPATESNESSPVDQAPIEEELKQEASENEVTEPAPAPDESPASEPDAASTPETEVSSEDIPVEEEISDTKTEVAKEEQEIAENSASDEEVSKKEEVTTEEEKTEVSYVETEASEEKTVIDEDSTSKDEDSKKEEVTTEEDTGKEEIITEQVSEKSTEQPEQEKLPNLKEINYIEFSKEELVDTLRKYISEFSLEEIKHHVETIKSVFYKIHNEETEKIHNKFIEDGGKEEDFKVEDSPVEINMKELLNIYREKRNELSKNLEEQKDVNLQAKYDIIEGIKELINSQESLNKTFHEFRNLQEKWREIGPVPQKVVKDLWESYHYHVEAFYDYIKINKELRDLDFKKNLNSKIGLCEKAEELLIEPSVVEAFRKLQVLHEQWREIGPVPADKRSEIWERFKDSTSKINHKHQEYFVNLKEEQKKNLLEKTVLCDKAEEIADIVIDNGKEWETKSNELIELQKVWKTIGFAPKKHNTKIYERFRAACDKFFDKKREYFSQNREEQENNLQIKTELCIQAEALQDSNDWKKTTDELIKLQKKWKTIGPVPIKNSDKIWKRFRAACDKFFNNKSSFFENIDSKYEDNLKAKEEIIQKIESFEPTENVSKNLEELKDLQREWSNIGFVPIKMKDEIQEKYRLVINEKFDQLKLDDGKKSILKFKSRVESIASKPNADRRLNMERDKCYNKLKQLESDITTWENNIGFFSNSKNAESLISDVENKINSAKQKMEVLQEKINILDDLD